MSLLAALRYAGAISAMAKVLSEPLPTESEADRLLERLLVATQNTIAAKRSGDEEWIENAVTSLNRAIDDVDQLLGRTA